MLKIITAPSPILSQTAKPVAKLDKSVLNLIEQMKQTLLSAQDPVGVGLAAPQIGKALRIFIIKQNHKSPISTFINPLIEDFLNAPSEKNQQAKQSETTRRAKEKSGINKNVQLEGCLSLIDIWGEVKRQPGVALSYQDEKGEKHSQKFYGFISTIIQHETDHLNGILFPKRVLEQKGKLYKSRKDEKGEDIFEEIEI
ncbi:MAG: peptide deformylase [Patescibacteria group bacterium]